MFAEVSLQSLDGFELIGAELEMRRYECWYRFKQSRQVLACPKLYGNANTSETARSFCGASIWCGIRCDNGAVGPVFGLGGLGLVYRIARNRLARRPLVLEDEEIRASDTKDVTSTVA